MVQYGRNGAMFQAGRVYRDAGGIEAIRNSYYALEPFMGGYYTNIEFDGASAAGNYGPAYDRLKGINGQYDGGNLFRMNSNIKPA